MDELLRTPPEKITDMTYKITVNYKGTSFPGEFEHLTPDQVDQCTGAFMRDMLGLPDSAVSKITIEKEDQHDIGGPDQPEIPS